MIQYSKEEIDESIKWLEENMDNFSGVARVVFQRVLQTLQELKA